MKFVTWWSPLIEPADEEQASQNKSVSDEIDIILKVESTDQNKKTL